MKNILIKWLFVFASVIFVTSSASAMTCTNLTKVLSKGSENSEVLKLQQFLFDSGYLTVNPNGYFGGGTVIAVRKFQGVNRLSQAGSVGPATREKIKSISCGTTSSLVGAKVSTSSSKVSDKKALSKQQLSNLKSKLIKLCLDKKNLGNAKFQEKTFTVVNESLGIQTSSSTVGSNSDFMVLHPEVRGVFESPEMIKACTQ